MGYVVLVILLEMYKIFLYVDVSFWMEIFKVFLKRFFGKINDGKYIKVILL